MFLDELGAWAAWPLSSIMGDTLSALFSISIFQLFFSNAVQFGFSDSFCPPLLSPDHHRCKNRFHYFISLLYKSFTLTSYLPRLFTKDMLTDPIGFLKNHLPEPEELE